MQQKFWLSLFSSYFPLPSNCSFYQVTLSLKENSTDTFIVEHAVWILLFHCYIKCVTNLFGSYLIGNRVSVSFAHLLCSEVFRLNWVLDNTFSVITSQIPLFLSQSLKFCTNFDSFLRMPPVWLARATSVANLAATFAKYIFFFFFYSVNGLHLGHFFFPMWIKYRQKEKNEQVTEALFMSSAVLCFLQWLSTHAQ